jgi:molecular chaperone GrpE
MINVEETIKNLEAQLQKSKEDHLRMAADYSNLVKRTEQEKLMLLEVGNQKILKDLLEILDDLEASASHSEDMGIKNILIKLKKVITTAGLEEIDALEKDFDPNLHEAIETTEGPENKIVKVFRKGYKTKNKVLRPSMVSVGTGN